MSYVQSIQVHLTLLEMKTVAAIQSFFLAMVLYPDVQKKAQAELDAVVGLNRLPGFEDLNSLPYVSALIKECTRWKMVSPLGVPHYTTENDEYRGYHIAKGTVVIAVRLFCTFTFASC